MLEDLDRYVEQRDRYVDREAGATEKKTDGVHREKHPDHIEHSRTFYDIIISVWPIVKDRKDILSEKQRAWIAAFMGLKSADMLKRPWAGVAGTLGITDSASLRLMKRIKATLDGKKDLIKEAIRGEMQDEIDDEKIDRRYTKLQRALADEPEALEKIRGHSRIKGVIHWKPVEVFVGQTGRSYMIGPGGETISDEEAEAHGLPIKTRQWHDPEPGQKWWNDRIVKECKRSGKPYSAVYQELMSEAYGRWPEGTPHSERFCRVCRCLLPLHDRMNGKLIKLNSKYCSDHCKTYAKRIKKRSVPR